MEAIKPMNPSPRRHLSASQTIALSFAAMILTGAALLTLPIASQSGQSIGFLDALFTATSANCVTGLVVVNTMEHWTLFGHIVILALIQLGGIGLITMFTAGMLVLRRRISLRSRLIIRASFNQESAAGMVRLLRGVVLITLGIEAIGAVFLSIGLYQTLSISVGQAIWYGVFQSISSFCNAGFDIFSVNSIVPYQTNLWINLPIMLLIVCGGLGFPVIAELCSAARNKNRHSLRFRVRHLSLHSKIAIIATAALIFGGAALFLIIEWNNPLTLGKLNPGEKTLVSFFQSITLRTCGYDSIGQGGLYDNSVLLSSLLMFIGGSPAGTAGGIKTVTLGVMIATVLSAFRGRDNVESMGRTLPLALLKNALTVFFTLLTVVVVSVFILTWSERNSAFAHDQLDLLFEICSAAGTVGVTTGITPYLSPIGKMTVILAMFIGRLSPMTVVVALNMRRNKVDDRLTYPDESVIIG